MGKRYNPDDIPDMETLDADGHFVYFTMYQDGRHTLSEIDPNHETSN
jgi:hypothetical protein